MRKYVVKKKRKSHYKTGKDGILDKHMMMIALIEGDDRAMMMFFAHFILF